MLFMRKFGCIYIITQEQSECKEWFNELTIRVSAITAHAL